MTYDLPFDHLEELDPDYLRELASLQVELLKLQAHLQDTQGRLLVIFEGRDAAGKGGAIFHFTQNLNPRHLRIVALPKPTPRESGQWYFQRYVQHLPNPGEIVFFDRSWYNRAVVEPVFGFCTEEQRVRFLEQANVLESMLHDDGLPIVKLWFSIDRQTQAERLAERERNPLRRWKLSPIDRAAQDNWDAYTHFKQEMFAATSTDECPWIVVQGNKKKSARLESIRYVLSTVDYPDPADIRLVPKPKIVRRFERS